MNTIDYLLDAEISALDGHALLELNFKLDEDWFDTITGDSQLKRQ